ncbi:MAG: ABC transporter ATP-binding protein [Bacillota bacterium]|nr:ABC transporter ATP-binding protein [Bacillota bacterium]
MEIRNISKCFEEERVLDNISISIPKGGRIVISGASGRGKTTLLRILMGIEAPDSGEIFDAPARFTAVFQEDRLPLEFSAMNCVGMVAPKSVTKAQLAMHLSELGLDEHMKKPVKELSGGMKRRVAICRAIICDGDAIYMDEPFTGLDIDTKKSVIEYINRHCKGRTLVIVSHSAEDAKLLNAKEIRI